MSGQHYTNEAAIPAFGEAPWLRKPGLRRLMSYRCSVDEWMWTTSHVDPACPRQWRRWFFRVVYGRWRGGYVRYRILPFHDACSAVWFERDRCGRSLGHIDSSHGSKACKPRSRVIYSVLLYVYDWNHLCLSFAWKALSGTTQLSRMSLALSLAIVGVNLVYSCC